MVVALSGAAGSIAVALTSRDYFAYWPAACVLLVSSAAAELRPNRASFPSFATLAGAVGLAAAAVGPDHQVLAPSLPIVGAAVVIILMRIASPWLARTRELEVRAAEYQHRAELSEAANLELQRRTALARELHDSLGHHVTAMVVQAEAGRVDDANVALACIADLGREALDELEAVLFDLRASPSMPDRSGGVDLDRIDSILAQPLRRHGVSVQVDVATAESDPERLAATYRIVQEALTNTMRHAAATEVAIAIKDMGSSLIVTVQDDGIGLPSKASGGNGLAGIRERAAQFGGEFEIVPAEPHGTLVRVVIPRASR